MESEAGPQGFEQGCYDIVIAANVLHATRDIRLALRNAKSLLKRNGFLLLNEITGKELVHRPDIRAARRMVAFPG